MADPHEHHPDAHRLTHDPEFQELVRRKNSISTALTVLMLIVYFGYFGVLAFKPEVLAAPFGRATLGIPLGIGVIIFAWVLTGLYVRWANTKYDALIRHIHERVEHAEFERNKASNEEANNQGSNA